MAPSASNLRSSGLKASPLALAPTQDNLARATALIARFYQDGSDWLGITDHNHLRITRIIRSLRLLAGDAAADTFRTAILRRVDETGAPVSGTSRAHWLAA